MMQSDSCQKNRAIIAIISGACIFHDRCQNEVVMKSDKSFVKMLGRIGSHLSDLRMKKGYATIKEFAQTNDLPEVQYWRIEKGKANITLKTLTRILNIHKLSLQDFLCLITSEKQIAK
jgi:hypothetical protein